MKKMLSELFNKYYKDVFRYLYGLSHDKYISEDLTSEVFLEVIKSIHSFKNQSDIKTWLFSIARHRWYAYLKKNKNKFMDIDEIENKYLSINDEYNSLKDLVDNVLEKESDLNKEIYRLRIEGYSYFEIAKKCGLKENSVRVIYFRLKNKIKDELLKEGVINE